MAVIGTFGSYTAARLAIYTAQANMNVTGNNIGNINTAGYTRQRTDVCSMYSVGTPRYQNSYNINIGYGAIVDNVSQLRDPFLDIRFRNENSNLGYYETMQSGLKQISHYLDEVGKGENVLGEDFGIIESQLGMFKNALNDLLQNPGATNYDDLARAAASTLCRLVNSAAKGLATVKQTEEDRLEESVDDINRILTNIRDLNEQIRTQEVYGNNALELRDARNLAIDELSKYMKITVSYSMEQITPSTEIEKLTISLADTEDPQRIGRANREIVLVDGVYATQFERAGTHLTDVSTDPTVQDLQNVITEIIRPEDRAKMALNPPTYTPRQRTLDVGQTVAVNPNYDPTAAAGTPGHDRYLQADGTTTDDIYQAAVINSFVEGADNNQYIFTLTPLTDKNDHIFNAGIHQGLEKESLPIQLGDNDLYGSLQALRELLTEEGEFSSKLDGTLDPQATVKRGIPYYQHMLDNFAQMLASEMNRLNTFSANESVPPVDGEVLLGDIYQQDTGNFKTKKDGVFVQVDDGTGTGTTKNLTVTDLQQAETDIQTAKDLLDATPMYAPNYQQNYDAYIAAQQKYYGYTDALREQGVLEEKYNFYDGGVLFSNNGNSDDPTGITALNITVAHSWTDGSVRVLNTREPNLTSYDENGGITYQPGTTRNDNLARFQTFLNRSDLSYTARDTVPDAAGTKPFFTGSFQEMFGKASSLLGTDTNEAICLYDNYNLTALELDNDRISVYGVDLNEEAANMMQFSQAFSAACTLLTTIDEMLDKLINGTL